MGRVCLRAACVALVCAVVCVSDVRAQSIGYLWGSDGEINYPEALRLLTAAAERGVPRAIVNLAYMYSKGLEVPRDIKKAILLYEGVGNKEFGAAIGLARIYADGLDVPRDLDLALKWYVTAVGFDPVECDDLTEAKEFILRHNRGTE